MNWNQNSSYGQQQSLAAHAVAAVPPSGKVFVVGDASTANRDMVVELYAPDTDATVRFHADIDTAIAACTAAAGDVILVLPGHAENLAADSAIDLDVAGVSIVGMGVGTFFSFLSLRFLTFTFKVPISFHVFTVGGGAFMFGGMNAVHQAKRYKEYIGFKQSGMANPEMIGLKDAKNQMADWMASAYSPEYVEEWRQSEEAEQTLQKQMAGIR